MPLPLSRRDALSQCSSSCRRSAALFSKAAGEAGSHLTAGTPLHHSLERLLQSGSHLSMPPPLYTTTPQLHPPPHVVVFPHLFQALAHDMAMLQKVSEAVGSPSVDRTPGQPPRGQSRRAKQTAGATSSDPSTVADLASPSAPLLGLSGWLLAVRLHSVLVKGSALTKAVRQHEAVLRRLADDELPATNRPAVDHEDVSIARSMLDLADHMDAAFAALAGQVGAESRARLAADQARSTVDEFLVLARRAALNLGAVGLEAVRTGIDEPATSTPRSLEDLAASNNLHLGPLEHTVALASRTNILPLIAEYYDEQRSAQLVGVARSSESSVGAAGSFFDTVGPFILTLAGFFMVESLVSGVLPELRSLSTAVHEFVSVCPQLRLRIREHVQAEESADRLTDVQSFLRVFRATLVSIGFESIGPELEPAFDAARERFQELSVDQVRTQLLVAQKMRRAPLFVASAEDVERYVTSVGVDDTVLGEAGQDLLALLGESGESVGPAGATATSTTAGSQTAHRLPYTSFVPDALRALEEHGTRVASFARSSDSEAAASVAAVAVAVDQAGIIVQESLLSGLARNVRQASVQGLVQEAVDAATIDGSLESLGVRLARTLPSPLPSPPFPRAHRVLASFREKVVSAVLRVLRERTDALLEEGADDRAWQGDAPTASSPVAAHPFVLETAAFVAAAQEQVKPLGDDAADRIISRLRESLVSSYFSRVLGNDAVRRLGGARVPGYLTADARVLRSVFQTAGGKSAGLTLRPLEQLARLLEEERPSELLREESTRRQRYGALLDPAVVDPALLATVLDKVRQRGKFMAALGGTSAAGRARDRELGLVTEWLRSRADTK